MSGEQVNEDAPSTRDNDDKAAKSSPSKQVDADANEKNLDQKDNLQSSVASSSGATGTSTETRENLKKLLQDPTEVPEKEGFETILRIAERQLSEGDGHSAIERVEEFLSKESRSARDVKNMADDLKEKVHYVQAIIIYKISHDLHKKEERFSPDDELQWIGDRTNDIHSAIRSLLEVGRIYRKVAIKIAVEFLTQFLEEIREVKGANPDRRALIEFHCLSRIAHVRSLSRKKVSDIIKKS